LFVIFCAVVCLFDGSLSELRRREYVQFEEPSDEVMAEWFNIKDETFAEPVCPKKEYRTR